MIIFALPHKPFTYTGKGTPRRHAIINNYEEEIGALYKQVEPGSLMEVTPPTEWNKTETLAFVRSVVTKGLGRYVEDGADVFRFGCDR